MPKEFSVEWRDHNWVPIISLHALQVGDASLHKVTGMPARRLFRGRTVVNLFHRNVTAGNAMIFNPG